MRSYLAAAMIFLIIFVASCTAGSPGVPTDTVSGASMQRYREGEIRDYQGAKLDPAIGPRDNSISGIQHVDISTYKLKITGLVDKTIELSYDEVLKLDAYERKITLHCIEGWDATILWKGILLEDLINMAGARPEANTVIFHAADHYADSLPLDTVISKQLILAYGSNGLTLPDELGRPFIVVAENKYGYKWVRWVSEIELSNDPGYLGFWEIGGYDIKADIPQQEQ
jgi:DMSO/TMAO reductase YedYZ molybdopterin-dependent catalytic subunit